MYTSPPGLIRGTTSRMTPVCTYSTLLRVVSELLVLTVVWLIGMLSPTWICACWLFSTTSEGAESTCVRPRVSSARRATCRLLLTKE
ncbi:hypothetical protein D3C81_1889930 [compost metagenome]